MKNRIEDLKKDFLVSNQYILTIVLYKKSYKGA